MVADLKLNIPNTVELKDFELLRTLGAGGFGTCYEAAYNGQHVALKKINRTSKVKAAAQSFKSETLPEIYGFNHPNIACLITASKPDAEEKFIILELIEGRNLQSIIDDSNENICFDRYVTFGIEIASALDYVSQFEMVHLDLKPANVMLSVDGVCKLTDFGCSQYADKDPSTPTRSYLTGTFAYRAPELLRGKAATPKADVFSLGICLWQFWSREFPYSGMNQHAVIFRVCSASLRPTVANDADIHEGYKALMKSCWSGKMEERPTAKAVGVQLKSMMAQITQ